MPLQPVSALLFPLTPREGEGRAAGGGRCGGAAAAAGRARPAGPRGKPASAAVPGVRSVIKQEVKYFVSLGIL